MARIWRGGCIIRARLLKQISDEYAGQRLSTLLVAPSIARGLAERQDALAPRRRARGDGGRPGAGVLLGAGLLRHGARRAAARRADPGAARQLRRAHLPAHRPRRHLPHAVVGRPERRSRRVHTGRRPGSRASESTSPTPVDRRQNGPARASTGSASPSPAGSTRPCCSRSPSARSAPAASSPSSGSRRAWPPTSGRPRTTSPGSSGVPVVEVATHEGDDPGLPRQRPRPVLPLQGRAVHADLRRGRRRARASTRSPTARTPTTPAAPTGPAPARPPSTPCCARSPTLGLDKADVRRARPRARAARAPTSPPRPAWPRGSRTSRVVDPAKLAQVEAAEHALRALGFTDCRVRHHGDVARVELPVRRARPRRGPRACASRLVAAVRAAGFRFVALDLAGIQSGAFTLPLVAGHAWLTPARRRRRPVPRRVAELDLGRAAPPRLPRGGLLRGQDPRAGAGDRRRRCASAAAPTA